MPEYPKSGPVKLKTNLADYAMTKALKSGAITSNLVTFDFCGPKVANQGFKQMVRERSSTPVNWRSAPIWRRAPTASRSRCCPRP
jgi:hypothetical protein